MPEPLVKHSTASAFVFHHGPGGWRLGLITHPLFRRPMIPGGHVEADETEEEAALREVTEETGLSVRLLPPPAPPRPADFTRTVVAPPWWTLEQPVPSDNHLAGPHVHVDHIYVALAEAAEAGPPGHPFGWHSAAELATLDVFEDTRALGLMLFGRLDELAEAS